MPAAFPSVRNCLDHLLFLSNYDKNIKALIDSENDQLDTKISHYGDVDQIVRNIGNSIDTESSLHMISVTQVYGNHRQAISLLRSPEPNGPLSALVLDSLPTDPQYNDFLTGAVPSINSKWNDLLSKNNDSRMIIVNVGTQIGLFECGDFALQAACKIRDFNSRLPYIHSRIRNNDFNEIEADCQRRNQMLKDNKGGRGYFIARLEGSVHNILSTNNLTLLKQISPLFLSKIIKYHMSGTRFRRDAESFGISNIIARNNGKTVVDKYNLSEVGNTLRGLNLSIYGRRLKYYRQKNSQQHQKNEKLLWSDPPLANCDKIPCGLQSHDSNLCGIYAIESALLRTTNGSLTDIRSELVAIRQKNNANETYKGDSLSVHEYISLYKKRIGGHNAIHRSDIYTFGEYSEIQDGRQTKPSGILTLLYSRSEWENIFSQFMTNEHSNSLSEELNGHFTLDNSALTAPRYSVLFSELEFSCKDELSGIRNAHWVTIGFSDKKWYLANSSIGETIPICNTDRSVGGALEALFNYIRHRIQRECYDNNSLLSTEPRFQVDILVPRFSLPPGLG